MAEYKTIPCERCGQLFETVKGHYCRHCRREASSKSAKERNLASMGGKAAAEKYRKPVPIKPKEKKRNVCDSYCDGCIYMGRVSTELRCCHYLLATNKRRPCPAGTGCTVKKTEAQAKKKTEAQAKKKTKVISSWTVKCQICGREFQTRDKRRRNCSYECLQISRHRASQRQWIRIKEERNG